LELTGAQASDVNTTRDVEFVGEVGIAGTVTVTTTGTVTFTEGSTILGGTLVINGTVITINSTIGSQTRPIEGLTLNGAVALEADVFVSHSGECGITIAGHTTVYDQRTLNAGSCPVSIAGVSAADFNDTLTITTSGDTNLNGNIVGLGGFTTNGGGTTFCNASVISIATAITTVELEPFVLTKDLEITDAGSGIFFRSTVDGAHNLTLIVTGPDGVVEFDGEVGGSTPLASLTVKKDVGVIITDATELPGGVITISKDVTTVGDQRYEASVLIDNDVELESTAGKVVVTSGLTGTTDSSLTIGAAGTNLSGTWSLVGDGSVTSITSAEQFFTDGSLNTESGAITVVSNSSSSATGDFVGLSVNNFSITSDTASIHLQGAGGTNGGNGMNIHSPVTATAEGVSLIGTGVAEGATGVNLGTSGTITTGGTGRINLVGTCNQTGSGAGYSIAGLLKPAGTGSDNFVGTQSNTLNVDSSKTDGSIVIVGDFQMGHWAMADGQSVGVMIASDMTWAPGNTTSLQTTGVVTINGDVTLSKDFIANDPSQLNLAGDITSSTPRTIQLPTLNTTADVEINAGAGETSTGLIIFGGTVTGTGSIAATGRVTLSADVTLTDKAFSVTGPSSILKSLTVDTGSGEITFQQLGGGGDEPVSLDLSSSGTTHLNGVVEGIGTLTTDADGETWINTPSISAGGHTEGTIHFWDAVKLQAHTTIRDSGGGVFFHKTLDGTFVLAVHATGSAGVVRFEGIVGGTAALRALSVEEGTTQIGTTITTELDQTFKGPSDLFADTVLNARTVAFSQGITDETNNLTLNLTDAYAVASVLDFAGAGSLTVTCPSLTMGEFKGFRTESGTITVLVESGSAIFDMHADSLISTDEGEISLTVHAASASAESMADVRGRIATTSGNIEITTTLDGGHSEGDADVLRVRGIISAGDGNATITTTGARAGQAAGGVTGLRLDGEALISSTNGELTITSDSGAEEGASGIVLAGTSRITTTNGNITVDGTSGGESPNNAILFVGGSIDETEAGNVTVTGTIEKDEASIHAIYGQSGFVQGSGAGNVLVTGVGGTIGWASSLVIAKTGGSYTIVGELQTTNPFTADDGNYAAILRGGGVVGPVTFNNSGDATLEVDDDELFDVRGHLVVAEGAESSVLNLAGKVVTDDGNVTVSRSIEVFGDSWLEADLVITLDGPIDADSDADPRPDLTVSGDSGSITGAVGGAAPLGEFDASAVDGVLALSEDIEATSWVSLRNIALADSVDVTVTDDDGRIVLDALDDDGSSETASALTLNASGRTDFQQPIGANAPIDSLETDLHGSTLITNNVTTNGLMKFNDPIEIASFEGTVRLADIGSGTGIVFGSTINDWGSESFPGSLTVSTTQPTSPAISFTGEVGGSKPLVNLRIESPFTITQDVTMTSETIALATGPLIITDTDIEPPAQTIASDLNLIGDTITNEQVLTFSGAASFSAAAALSFAQDGGEIHTDTGSIDILVNEDGAKALTSAIVLHLGGGISTNSGAITLKGNAGDAGTAEVGVRYYADLTTQGSVTIEGTGDGVGVVYAGTITGTEGDVTITGNGRSGVTEIPSGFAADGEASIQTTTGNITLTGNTSSSVVGLFLSATPVTTTSGLITITGNGGSWGVVIDDSEVGGEGATVLVDGTQGTASENFQFPGGVLIGRSAAGLYEAIYGDSDDDDNTARIWSDTSTVTVTGSGEIGVSVLQGTLESNNTITVTGTGEYTGAWLAGTIGAKSGIGNINVTGTSALAGDGLLGFLDDAVLSETMVWPAGVQVGLIHHRFIEDPVAGKFGWDPTHFTVGSPTAGVVTLNGQGPGESPGGLVGVTVIESTVDAGIAIGVTGVGWMTGAWLVGTVGGPDSSAQVGVEGIATVSIDELILGFSLADINDIRLWPAGVHVGFMDDSLVFLGEPDDRVLVWDLARISVSSKTGDVAIGGMGPAGVMATLAWVGVGNGALEVEGFATPIQNPELFEILDEPEELFLFSGVTTLFAGITASTTPFSHPVTPTLLADIADDTSWIEFDPSFESDPLFAGQDQGSVEVTGDSVNRGSVLCWASDIRVAGDGDLSITATNEADDESGLGWMLLHYLFMDNTDGAVSIAASSFDVPVVITDDGEYDVNITGSGQILGGYYRDGDGYNDSAVAILGTGTTTVVNPGGEAGLEVSGDMTIDAPIGLSLEGTIGVGDDFLVASQTTLTGHAGLYSEGQLTINQPIDGGFYLELEGSTGGIDAAIGGETPLAELLVYPGTLDWGGPITTAVVSYDDEDDSTANVTIQAALSLVDDLTISASSGQVSLQAIEDDDDDTSAELTVNTTGWTIFGDTIGGTFPIDRITTDEEGTTFIHANMSAIASGGSINFSDSVELVNDVSLHGNSGITFGGTVDSDTGENYDLSLTLSTNTVSFLDDVGARDPLGDLTITGKPARFENEPTVWSTGIQTYNDGIQAGDDPYTLRAADLEFNGDVLVSQGPTFAPFSDEADLTVNNDFPVLIVVDDLDLIVRPEFILDGTDWGHLVSGASGHHVYLNTSASTGNVYFDTTLVLNPVTVLGGSELHMPNVESVWTLTGQNAGGITATEFDEAFDFESIETGKAGTAADELNFSATGYFDTAFDGNDGEAVDTLKAHTAADFVVNISTGTVTVGENTFAFHRIEEAYGSEDDDTFTFENEWAALPGGIVAGGHSEGDIATWTHTGNEVDATYGLSDGQVSWAIDGEEVSQPIEGLETALVNHGSGSDSVDLLVSETLTWILDGADPDGGEGDTLLVDGQQDEGATWTESGFAFENFMPVNHTNFEWANVTNVPVDLGVEITDASEESVEPEDEITYTATFINHTPTEVTAVLSFVVPANTKLTGESSWTCLDEGQAGDTCSQEAFFELNEGMQDDPTVREIPLTVITPVSAGSEYIELTVAIAHVDPGEVEPIVDHVSENDSDTVQTTLIAEPDLAITIADSPDPVTDSEDLTYTIVVTNEGNQGATGVVTTVTMPQHGTFNSGESSDGWSCDSEECTLEREEELAGGDASFETKLVFTMPSSFPSGAHQLAVTASVTDDGLNSTVPNTPTTASDDQITTIDAEPDMVVTITDGDARVETASDIVYTVDIQNAGNQDAVGVVVTVSVPTYTTLKSIEPSAGWDCDASECANEVDEVDSGETGQFVFTFTTDATIPAGVEFLFIEAEIHDDQSNGEEPTPDNNTAEDSTPFDAEPDMHLVKVANTDDAEPGQDIAYTLTMSNVGDQGATGLVLNETVPVNTTYNALESTVGWTCEGASAGSPCEFPIEGMEALAGRTVIFSVTVDDILPAGETIVHNEALLLDDDSNATATTEGRDPTPDNDEDFVDVNLNHQPGLLVGLTHTGEDLPMPEDLIPFDVEWANTGAQGVSGVVMTMAVPEGTTFSPAHSDAWDCGDATEAGTECTYGDFDVEAGGGGMVVFAVIADDDLEPGAEIHQDVEIHDDGSSASEVVESDTADEDVLLNREPEVDNEPASRNATEGQEMAWHLPDDIFTDPDTVRGDTLTVTASSDAPAWVNLDDETLIFSGVPTPSDVGETVTFEVTATDERGLTASFDLDFVVNNVNNAPTIEDGSQVAATDIWEDDVDNEGDLVSDLIEELIDDADVGASTGIALVYADDTNGIWEFRLDDDDEEWTELGTLSESDALVIDAGDEERLRFVPNPDYFGVVEGRFVAWDGTDGSVSGDVEVVLGETGGDSAFSSGSALLSVDVLSVNDAPSFIAGEDVAVAEDAGAISVSNWAIDMLTGPENESEQSFDFELTTDADALFSELPAIDGDGTLTFQTARNAEGSVTVTVVAMDDGGTERDGVDTSDGVDFTIAIGAVNDGPLFVDPTPSGTIEVNENEELEFQIVAEDPDGPELILTVNGAPASAVVNLENGTFTWTPTYLDWGVWEVVLNAHDGTLFDERVLEIVVIVADTNDNGIPDTFETNNGLDLDNDDADGDGIPNLVEIGDYTDPSDSDHDDIIDAVETDSDDDGVDDEIEAGDDPENPVDSDEDGTPDYQDTDSDDDELMDDEDNCRTVVNVDQADRDEDGEGDLCDNDIDGDGLENDDELDIDLDPEDEDTDGDTIGDGDEVSDASDPEDTDDDGIIDALDPDSDDDGLIDADEAGDDLVGTEPIDTDDDGTPNFRDTDSDGDDVDDVDDNCPLVENTDQIDTDGDGDGDDCDGDSDGDGLDDEEDNCVWVVNPDQNDQDTDGEGDDCDDDQDGDGVVNVDDNCPLSVNPNQEDDDIDGMGNECDPLTSTAEPPGCNCSAAADDSSAGLTWFLAAVIGLVATRRRGDRG